MTVGYDKKVVKKTENGQLLISKKVNFFLFWKGEHNFSRRTNKN